MVFCSNIVLNNISIPVLVENSALYSTAASFQLPKARGAFVCVLIINFLIKFIGFLCMAE